MRIALIGKRYYTNNDLIKARYGRLYHFPYQWRQAGDEILFIAADYKSQEKEVFDLQGMRYESVPFRNIFRWYSSFVKKRLIEYRPDIIVASCDSHFGFAAQKIAHLLKIPFVFDLYHYYPDFGSNRIPGMKWMFHRAVANSDLVVCDSEVLKTKVVDVAKRTLVAQQGVDFDYFYPHDMHRCRSEFDLPGDKKLIGYTGSLDSRFDWQILAPTISALRAKGVDCCFVIAGPQVHNMDLNIDGVIYLGTLPQEHVVKVISACDIMVLPYKKTKLADTCNPSKLVEYIACEKPLVAADVSNISDLLNSVKNSIYTPGDFAGFASCIHQQLIDPSLASKSMELSWQSIALEYRNELEALLVH